MYWRGDAEQQNDTMNLEVDGCLSVCLCVCLCLYLCLCLCLRMCVCMCVYLHRVRKTHKVLFQKSLTLHKQTHAHTCSIWQFRNWRSTWSVSSTSVYNTYISAREASWKRFSTPCTVFCLICTINSELKDFLIFTHLSEPGLISAGFQWKSSTPAGFQKAFRAVYVWYGRTISHHLSISKLISVTFENILLHGQYRCLCISIYTYICMRDVRKENHKICRFRTRWCRRTISWSWK